MHLFARTQHADTHFPAQAALVHELPIELAPFELPAGALEALTELVKGALRAATAAIDIREDAPRIADADPGGVLRVVTSSNAAGHGRTVPRLLCGYPVILTARRPGRR